MKFILLKLSTLALLVSAGVSAESTGLRGPTGAASENAASGSGDVDAALPAFFPPDLAEDRIIQLKKNGECARDCKDDFPRGDRRQDCIDDCANKRKVKQNAQCARSCADDFPRGDRRQDCIDDCDICVVDCADDFPRGDRRQDCVDDCAAGQLKSSASDDNGECVADCKDDFPRGDRRQDCIDDCANKRKVKKNAQCARSCADDFPRGDRRQDCIDDCDICVVDCADDFPRGDRRQDCVDDCAAGQLKSSASEDDAECVADCRDDFPRGDRRQDCIDDCDDRFIGDSTYRRGRTNRNGDRTGYGYGNCWPNCKSPNPPAEGQGKASDGQDVSEDFSEDEGPVAASG